MRVYNELTKRFCSKSGMVRCIIGIYDDYIEFGYYPSNYEKIFPIYYNFSSNPNMEICEITYIIDFEKNAQHLVFSNATGYYIIKKQFTEEQLLRHLYIKGSGGFPYSFKRNYEAMESFNIFDKKQVVLLNKNYNLSKHLKYTFGLEFETSCGYVPENLCFRDGLIPLRDGSISGLEYSTVVLQGNNGLNLLNQQIKTLSKYTYFNKECALHIHMGGYPIEPKAIFVLYAVCVLLEEKIKAIIPKYSFKTSLYKRTQKDYCHELPRVDRFEDLYTFIANMNFTGSLVEPHPYDVNRNHKWECHSRYVWCNLLNMVCFDKCKTVEFRFLRPTYNFNKIYLWMAIFNAILLYAEMMTKKFANEKDGKIIQQIYKERISLEMIVQSVYPKRFAENVISGINKLRISVINQHNNEDFCGKDTFFDDELITDIF